MPWRGALPRSLDRMNLVFQDGIPVSRLVPVEVSTCDAPYSEALFSWVD